MGGGGEHVTVAMKGRTQVDAWPMLAADAGKNLESHHVDPSKHEFAGRVFRGEHADPLAS